MTKRAVFIGRYSPFHIGHLSIMKKKIDEGKPLLILVRNTSYDIYSPELRKKMIEAAMLELKANVKVEIIDDIESVNYGRGVGYKVNEIEVPEDIKRISATEIRTMIENKNHSWKEHIPLGADKVLQDHLSKRGVVVWFTGLPKSGKKTIANAVSDKLEKKGVRVERLDGGILRNTVSKDLGFSKDDRTINIERATFIAKLLSRNGAVVLCSFITPYESERIKLRDELQKEANFIEVYVQTSLQTCKLRDRNKLYEKAEKGEIKHFTGVSDPFQEPQNPEIIIDSERNTTEECAKQIIDYIKITT